MTYPAGSNGSVAPSTTIIPIDTDGYLIDQYPYSGGIALDSNKNIYMVSPNGSYLGNGSITVYPAGSNGDATPSAIISADDYTGSDNTGLGYPSGIVVDSTGRIYVTNAEYYGPGGVIGPPTVTVYPPGSNGNVTPIAIIMGANTRLSSPWGIALDSSGNIYVVDDGADGQGPGSVFVYPPLGSSTGPLNEAPVATISGTNTGLSLPVGIALDSSGNIYVGNNSTISPVTVYPPASNGNVAPMAIIGGSNTDLEAGPVAIAVGPISP